ncbi:hypothetical protein Dsin_027765 [Dipteronia sinensis]|uniref:BHLH domain-containing protein n=1 Tax=Dipteronia sinensis TaxID=43782 RepID=A0AAD9ZPS6_9ROSI|nr:hypothetical protein Dsin_027765 [Dipteronia sinensis]
MAEEICGGTWWNPARSSTLLSPCSGGINGITDNHIGSFGWSSNSSSTTTDHHHHHHNLHHMVDMKPSAVAVTTTTAANSTDLKQQHSTDSDSNTTGGSSSNNSSILMDSSTLQMINFGLSASSTSSSTDWNPAALVLRENHMNSQIQKDWSPTNLAAASYGYPSTLLQSLFEPDEVPLQTQQQQQCLFNNRSIINNSNYMSGGNYGTNVVSNDIQLSPNNSWPPKNNIANPLLKPSLLQKNHQQTTSSSSTTTTGFHFSNNATFWNPSAASAPLNDVRTAFYHPSTTQSHQFLTPPSASAAAIEEKPSCTTLTAKSNNEEVRESVSVVGKKGNSSEPAFKRPRIETPSPLPTFKVRKEKLGDRITALQQLVSPFGKTDTASVLHEAIDYIRLLHEQVNILSTPYMKQGTPIQQQQQSCEYKLKDPDQLKQDLKSRGLCLVPIASTFPVANEATVADLWTPTYGGSYR